MDRPTSEMLRRWKPVLKRMSEACSALHGFKIAAEFSMEDEEFLVFWRKEVEKQKEPVRGRAISFLNRLAKRDETWNFEREFRKSFN